MYRYVANNYRDYLLYRYLTNYPEINYYTDILQTIQRLLIIQISYKLSGDYLLYRYQTNYPEITYYTDI